MLAFVVLLLFSFAFSLDACVKIVEKLAPKPPALLYSLRVYAQYQKDLEGKTTQTAPVNAGIRVDIPILDKREEIELKERYLRNLNEVRILVQEYLALRYEVEEMEKFLNWMWIRVDYGIEYRRDVWQLQIKLQEKKGRLKALTTLLMSAGITREDLDQCYKSKF